MIICNLTVKLSWVNHTLLTRSYASVIPNLHPPTALDPSDPGPL